MSKGPKIFQTMNSVRSKYSRLKHQRFMPSGCKNIGIRNFEYMTKTPFLYLVDIESLNYFVKLGVELVEEVDHLEGGRLRAHTGEPDNVGEINGYSVKGFRLHSDILEIYRK